MKKIDDKKPIKNKLIISQESEGGKSSLSDKKIDISNKKRTKADKKKSKTLNICLLASFLILTFSLTLVSASLNVQLSDQGTGVAYLNGTTLSSGDLTVLIYTASSGGSPIYNETFSNAISNGSWNVMLGSGGTNLPLEFGKVYYKDYLIAGENASFDGSDRQAFYSPLGDISDEDISDSTNLTLGQKIVFALGGFIQNIIGGQIDINGTLNVTGNAIVEGNVTASYFIGDGSQLNDVNYSVPDNSINGTELADTITLDANMNIDGGYNFSVDTSDLFVDVSSERVGIGTTTPTQKLDVNGSVNVTGTGFFSWLGSLVNRITTLFVQDINVNGTLNVSGNITLNGTNIDDWSDIQSSGGSQWNITTSSYLINNSGILDVNESILNSSINTKVLEYNFVNASTTDKNVSANVATFTTSNVTGTGFFGWLGSLVNRITTLFVQDIDASGNINASNYTLNGTTIDDWSDVASVSDTQKSGGGIYLYNDSSTIYLNETVLNTTINFLENDTLADLSCSSDEIAKYNGSLWQCASESASGSMWINNTNWTYINTTLAPNNVSVSNVNVTGTLYVSDDSIYIRDVKFDLARYGISTGILSGGTLTINAANNSLLNVTAGTAIIANLSDIDNVVVNTVSWDAQIIYPNLEGVRSKWVGIQRLSNGSAEFVFATAFTALEKRTTAVLGRAWGAGTDTITGRGNYATPAFGSAKLVEDLVYALGSLNIDGNIFSANGANLRLNKSAGESFRFSAAFGTSPTSPNIHTDAAKNNITSYKYHLQDSTTTTTEVDIDPDNYDVSGVKTSVPSNKYTLQRIYYFPVSQTIHVTYGQELYNSLSEAVADAGTDDVSLNSDILSGSILRGWLAIEKGATDLTITSDAQFIAATNLGSSGGGGGGSSDHSALSNLEWSSSGHTFSSAATMSIGSYNFTTTGRIGIGTSNPTQKLDVNGSVNISEDLIVNNSDLFVDVSTGRVGIGTTSPSTKLEVVGIVNISSGELWINEVNNTAPDYVFEPDYNLMFLDEVKSYTEINKHLPDSEIQGSWDNSVQKKQNFLLEKIEEIFLHLFGIDERVDNLEAENDLLKSELCVRDNSYSWC